MSTRPAPVTEQNLERYLSEDGRITPGTYLARTLEGTAKQYQVHYLRRRERRLRDLAVAGEVEPCRSVRGATGYRRVTGTGIDQA